MVTIELEKCTHCGVCTSRFKGFCIGGEGGKPGIDYSVCNQCQKCVAICPSRAITMNGAQPDRLEGPSPVGHAELRELLRRRRSCKKFRAAKVPRDILLDIAGAASFAPNQNKNIEIVIVDDAAAVAAIDMASMKSVLRWYRLLFSVKPLAWFFGLFSRSLKVLRRKMELDLFERRCIVKENAACLFLTIGDARVPVTEESAQYLLGTMAVCAESLGVGSCLMDSVKHSINQCKKLKRELGIPKGWKVLGVLAAGYSGEHVVNIPRGYEVPVSWNRRN